MRSRANQRGKNEGEKARRRTKDLAVIEMEWPHIGGRRRQERSRVFGVEGDRKVEKDAALERREVDAEQDQVSVESRGGFCGRARKQCRGVESQKPKTDIAEPVEEREEDMLNASSGDRKSGEKGELNYLGFEFDGPVF